MGVGKIYNIKEDLIQFRVEFLEKSWMTSVEAMMVVLLKPVHQSQIWLASLVKFQKYEMKWKNNFIQRQKSPKNNDRAQRVCTSVWQIEIMQIYRNRKKRHK